MLEVSYRGVGRGSHYWENFIRSRLAGIGFREAITTSFAATEKVIRLYGEGCFEPVKLSGPMSSDMDILRPSLLVTLLDCVRHNLFQRHRDLMLYEIGSAFAREPGGEDSGEKRRLAMAVSGRTRPVFWRGEADQWDFFALKGVLETLLAHLRVGPAEFTPGGDKLLSASRNARISIGGEPVGQIGLLDPTLARELDLEEQEIYLLEIDLQPLVGATEMPTYKPSSPYPGIRRDLSMFVDKATPAAELVAVAGAVSKLVCDVTVFDLYEGEHVPAGKRSIALSFLFQSSERTLKDEEADGLFRSIVDRLKEKFGIQPR